MGAECSEQRPKSSALPPHRVGRLRAYFPISCLFDGKRPADSFDRNEPEIIKYSYFSSSGLSKLQVDGINNWFKGSGRELRSSLWLQGWKRWRGRKMFHSLRHRHELQKREREKRDGFFSPVSCVHKQRAGAKWGLIQTRFFKEEDKTRYVGHLLCVFSRLLLTWQRSLCGPCGECVWEVQKKRK